MRISRRNYERLAGGDGREDAGLGSDSMGVGQEGDDSLSLLHSSSSPAPATHSHTFSDDDPDLRVPPDTVQGAINTRDVGVEAEGELEAEEGEADPLATVVYLGLRVVETPAGEKLLGYDTENPPPGCGSNQVEPARVPGVLGADAEEAAEEGRNLFFSGMSFIHYSQFRQNVFMVNMALFWDVFSLVLSVLSSSHHCEFPSLDDHPLMCGAAETGQLLVSLAGAYTVSQALKANLDTVKTFCRRLDIFFNVQATIALVCFMSGDFSIMAIIRVLAASSAKQAAAFMIRAARLARERGETFETLLTHAYWVNQHRMSHGFPALGVQHSEDPPQIVRTVEMDPYRGESSAGSGAEELTTPPR